MRRRKDLLGVARDLLGATRKAVVVKAVVVKAVVEVGPFRAEDAIQENETLLFEFVFGNFINVYLDAV